MTRTADTSPPTSEGQAALRRLPLSHAEIAVAIGVARSAVAQWRSGRTKPSEHHAAALAARFGIAVQSWGQRPADAPAPPLAPPAESLEAQLEALPRPAGTDDDELRRMIDRLVTIRDDRNASAATVTKSIGVELGCRRELERRRADIDRLIDGEEWRALRRIILGALEPFPEARAALLGKLTEATA